MQQPAEKQADARFSRPPGNDAEGGGGARPELKGKEKNWMKKWVLIFRACILCFSFISVILVIAFGDFYKSTELSYVLGVAFITTFYMAVQVGIKGHEFRTKTELISPKIAVWIDFSGDQFLAYMIFSSASVGAAGSTGLRKELLIDAGLELMAASVAMFFFAFLLLAPVTLVSGFRLATVLSIS